MVSQALGNIKTGLTYSVRWELSPVPSSPYHFPLVNTCCASPLLQGPSPWGTTVGTLRKPWLVFTLDDTKAGWAQCALSIMAEYLHQHLISAMAG